MFASTRPSTPSEILSFTGKMTIASTAIGAATGFFIGAFSGRIIPDHIFKVAVISGCSAIVGALVTVGLQRNKSMSFEAKLGCNTVLSVLAGTLQILAFRHLGIIATRGTIVMAALTFYTPLYALVTSLTNPIANALLRQMYMGDQVQE